MWGGSVSPSMNSSVNQRKDVPVWAPSSVLGSLGHHCGSLGLCPIAPGGGACAEGDLRRGDPQAAGRHRHRPRARPGPSSGLITPHLRVTQQQLGSNADFPLHGMRSPAPPCVFLCTPTFHRGKFFCGHDLFFVPSNLFFQRPCDPSAFVLPTSYSTPRLSGRGWATFF